MALPCWHLEVTDDPDLLKIGRNNTLQPHVRPT